MWSPADRVSTGFMVLHYTTAILGRYCHLFLVWRREIASSPSIPSCIQLKYQRNLLFSSSFLFFYYYPKLALSGTAVCFKHCLGGQLWPLPK